LRALNQKSIEPRERRKQKTLKVFRDTLLLKPAGPQYG